jgi:hypothetical protein
LVVVAFLDRCPVVFLVLERYDTDFLLIVFQWISCTVHVVFLVFLPSFL